ncbi:hypothetical protein V6N13_029101 [Hibiscus sabdariffa]
MAIKAPNMNLFPPQFIPNKDFMKVGQRTENLYNTHMNTCIPLVETLQKAFFEERRKRQSGTLITAIQEVVMKKLEEKEYGIQRMGKLNWVLQEKVKLKSLCSEKKLWRDMAQTNEVMANFLRTDLEQILAHVGEECHANDVRAEATLVDAAWLAQKGVSGLFDLPLGSTSVIVKLSNQAKQGLYRYYGKKMTYVMVDLLQVAKKTAQKRKIILTDIERWQKGVASTVASQQASKPVPLILVKCADYLVLSGVTQMKIIGLNSQYLFKAEGEQLVTAYNQDFNASIREGANPIDVAALTKYYIASLPEPLTTFELYDEIKGARSSIHAMRNVLKKLPSLYYMTLEFITALLLLVSQKSVLNKMDARSLAMEMAPVIMWQKDRKPESYRKYWRMVVALIQPLLTVHGTCLLEKYPLLVSLFFFGANSLFVMATDDGEDMDASSHIPLDDGMPVDFGAIEVIQCLIEQHNPIFTDANETVWR